MFFHQHSDPEVAHLSEGEPVLVVVVEAAFQVCCELGVVYVLQQGLERRHQLVLWPNKHKLTLKPYNDMMYGSLPAKVCGVKSQCFCHADTSTQAVS